MPLFIKPQNNNMIKLNLKHFLAIAMLSSFTTNAQLTDVFRKTDRLDNLEDFDSQKFSWGFYLAANNFDSKLVLDPKYGMDGQQNAILVKPSFSFGAGLIGKIRLSEYIDLRAEPGLHFTQREFTFNTQSNSQYAAGTDQFPAFTPITLTDVDRIKTVKSTYLDVPIMLEFHGDRWNNTRPYAAGGINYLMNLQSNENSAEDNSRNIFRSTTHNFGWTAELGIQLYFSRFKLTPAIRGTFLMNNEIVADNADTAPYWAAGINNMNTRAFMFVLKFE